jgi:hypothetical protein
LSDANVEGLFTGKVIVKGSTSLFFCANNDRQPSVIMQKIKTSFFMSEKFNYAEGVK